MLEAVNPFIFCTRFLLTFDVHIKYVSEASYGNKIHSDRMKPELATAHFRKGIL
jgi:hypothetical protein